MRAMISRTGALPERWGGVAALGMSKLVTVTRVKHTGIHENDFRCLNNSE